MPNDTMNKNPGSTCIRCGTCCKKGGPALHTEDRALVESGKIPAKHLFTIREQEPSFDNIADKIIPAKTDIIKIKAKKGSRACMFFDKDMSGCTIYENRPIECKSLKCWDTREISRIYAMNRLTRKDLVSGIDGLWELIEDHQSRCSYKKITVLAEDAKKQAGNSPVIKMLTEIIAYDTNIRPLIMKQGGMDQEMLEFLFGRPLTQTITMFGLKMGSNPNELKLLQSDMIRPSSND